MKLLAKHLLRTFIFTLALTGCGAEDSDDVGAGATGGDDVISEEEQADIALYECGDECVQRATYHFRVVSFSPEHLATSISINPTITLELYDDFPGSLSDINIELFGVSNSTENCRIDWPGFRCGSLNAEDSFLLLDGVTNEDPTTANILFGTSSVLSGSTVEFNLDGELTAGITYVVHIYADNLGDEDNFKTWWIFKT